MRNWTWILKFDWRLNNSKAKYWTNLKIRLNASQWRTNLKLKTKMNLNEEEMLNGLESEFKVEEDGWIVNIYVWRRWISVWRRFVSNGRYSSIAISQCFCSERNKRESSISVRIERFTLGEDQFRVFFVWQRKSERVLSSSHARLEYRERRIFLTLKRILHRWNHGCM